MPFAIPKSNHDPVPVDREDTEVTYDLLHGQWYLDANGTAPQLPFGHGLGYTTFEIEQVEVVKTTTRVSLENTGERAGSTVVMVFAGMPNSAFERPKKTADRVYQGHS